MPATQLLFSITKTGNKSRALGCSMSVLHRQRNPSLSLGSSGSRPVGMSRSRPAIRERPPKVRRVRSADSRESSSEPAGERPRSLRRERVGRRTVEGLEGRRWCAEVGEREERRCEMSLRRVSGSGSLDG